MNLRDHISNAMKRQKAEVDYSIGKLNAHCGICEYYSDHECSKVIGVIKPEMWCELFELKS